MTAVVDKLVVVEQTEANTKSKAMRAAVLTFRVTDAGTYAKAGDMVKQTKAAWAALDAKRTAITKPILEGKRQVDLLFKPSLDDLHAMELHLKSQLGAYAQRQELEQAKVAAESAAEIRAGIVPTAIVPEVPYEKGIQTKSVWDFEVIDAAAVPRELCSPDPALIGAKVAYADTIHTPPQPIPGVRFYLRPTVVVRR